MQTVTQTIKSKGDRLLTEDRIRRILGHTYTVYGDHDEYTVSVSFPQEASGRCSCPAGKEGTLCSHLYAASVYDLAHPIGKPRHLKPLPDPFEGLS